MIFIYKNEDNHDLMISDLSDSLSSIKSKLRKKKMEFIKSYCNCKTNIYNLFNNKQKTSFLITRFFHRI